MIFNLIGGTNSGEFRNEELENMPPAIFSMYCDFSKRFIYSYIAMGMTKNDDNEVVIYYQYAAREDDEKLIDLEQTPESISRMFERYNQFNNN